MQGSRYSGNGSQSQENQQEKDHCIRDFAWDPKRARFSTSACTASDTPLDVTRDSGKKLFASSAPSPLHVHPADSCGNSASVMLSSFNQGACANGHPWFGTVIVAL